MSNISASNYLIERDPWLQKLGARNPGERIEQSCNECFPKILRGRPTYDRLPGAAQAYNKENNDYLSRGTIIIPEALTTITSAEDIFFRERFPKEYATRDYISGSYFGPGSGAALSLNNLKPINNGTNITDLEILIRSATIFWGESRIRDASNISKDTQLFPGLILTLPLTFSGWIFIDGAGSLQIQEQLPDSILNLTDNIWCNSNSPSKICAKRIRAFTNEDTLFDKLDLSEGSSNVLANSTNTLEPLLYEVSPLYKFSTINGKLTLWEDYRRFNREFDAPVAKWLTDHGDNFLMDKKEQIDTFFDDYLYPDSVGLFLLRCDGPIRSSYKSENVNKLVDSWDFGLINEESLRGPFDFITNSELDDFLNYDFYTNKILDWLAQHFGFIDNGTKYNIWHNGSSYGRSVNNGDVFYNISEKRAILRNAYTQDVFQDYDYENKEFYFTRFPFSLYNRLKPSNWDGLLKARGTKAALEFMFDVLGLHGYKSYTMQPRYTDSLLDFDEALDLIKYSNKPLINYIKELTPEGTIIDRLPLAYNDINYSETGVFKVGESVFAEGHDKRYVLRVPFSWDRPSKNWNRVKEISNTYALNDTINIGYYYYVIGKSAAGECIFENEKTLITEYILSEEYISIPEIYSINNVKNLYLNYTDTYNKYIKTLSLDYKNKDCDVPLLNDVSVTKFKYIDPIYLKQSTILYAAQIIDSSYSFINSVPLLMSVDNGHSFNYVTDTNIIGAESTYKIRTVHKMSFFNGTIYLMGRDSNGEDKMFISSDNAQSFTEYNLPENTTPLDIIYDNENQVTYLAMGTKTYYKYNSNGTWNVLIDSYFLNDYESIDNVSIINNNNGIYILISVRLPTANYDNELRILYTANKGMNKFLLYKETVPLFDEGSSQLKVQIAPQYLYSDDTFEFVILHGTSNYSASRITVRAFDGTDFVDKSEELKIILQNLILEQDSKIEPNFIYNNGTPSVIATNHEYITWNKDNIFNTCLYSDVILNYETKKFDLLITLIKIDASIKLFIKESIIVSFSKKNFSDLSIIKRNINTHLDSISRTDGLNRATSIPRTLLASKKTINDIYV